jgi:rhamnopyranosyl-N-acetylglucosaminyl-diphospho-decaprenol beta-1,3/1,4-galactofuranosyltransferase
VIDEAQPAAENRAATIAAALVTYNRKELLIECLDKLLQQTRPVDRIILIDNASTDGTPEYLKQRGYLDNPVIDYVRMPENTGGAGGFYEGVKRGYNAGYQWLWLMDDDVEPTANALETMLPYAAFSKCIQAARIYADGKPHPWERWVKIDKSGKRTGFDHGIDGDHIAVQVACFEGMLIHRDVVCKIGFPDRRFFIGGDDTAYGYLASKQTQNIYITKPCFVKKIMKSVAPPKKLFARISDRFKVVRPQRFYFLSIRNEFLLKSYIRDAIQPGRFYARVYGQLLRHSVTTLVCERSPQNFMALWKGMFEGMSLEVPAQEAPVGTDRRPEAVHPKEEAVQK